MEPVKITIPPEKLAAAVSKHFLEPLLKLKREEAEKQTKKEGA